MAGNYTEDHLQDSVPEVRSIKYGIGDNDLRSSRSDTKSDFHHRIMGREPETFNEVRKTGKWTCDVLLLAPPITEEPGPDQGYYKPEEHD